VCGAEKRERMYMKEGMGRRMSVAVGLAGRMGLGLGLGDKI